MEEERRACHLCGRQEPESTAALTWSTGVEGGRAVSFCAPCTREHLRALEGKLDSEWW